MPSGCPPAVPRPAPRARAPSTTRIPFLICRSPECANRGKGYKGGVVGSIGPSSNWAGETQPIQPAVRPRFNVRLHRALRDSRFGVGRLPPLVRPVGLVQGAPVTQLCRMNDTVAIRYFPETSRVRLLSLVTVAGTMDGCYPGELLNVQGADIVVTAYDQGFNFSSVLTWAMRVEQRLRSQHRPGHPEPGGDEHGRPRLHA